MNKSRGREGKGREGQEGRKEGEILTRSFLGPEHSIVTMTIGLEEEEEEEEEKEEKEDEEEKQK